jgi:hypothetical protein
VENRWKPLPEKEIEKAATRGALGGALQVDGEEQKVLLLGHRENYSTIIGYPSNLARRESFGLPLVSWKHA